MLRQQIPSSTAAPSATDDALMRRVQADDREAFATLYERHHLEADIVARSVSHRRDRAEEAVQEGFLSIWRDRNTYEPRAAGSLRSWSMAIVRNRAIDIARHNGVGDRLRAREPETHARVAPGCTERDQIARDENDALRAALAHLPAKQEEVILMAFYGELTHTEIAERLGLPKGTVKGRMRLGLEKLHAAVRSPD